MIDGDVIELLLTNKESACIIYEEIKEKTEDKIFYLLMPLRLAEDE